MHLILMNIVKCIIAEINMFYVSGIYKNVFLAKPYLTDTLI